VALVPVQDRGDPWIWFDPRQHANDLHEIVGGDIPMATGANLRGNSSGTRSILLDKLSGIV